MDGKMKKGQINRGSNLGEEIFNLSRRNNVKTIVEIGTWNGMGSTKCIYDAVKGTDKLVYSLECNKDRYEEATKNLRSLGKLPVNFNLLHGSIVNVDELVPIFNSLKNEVFKDWLKVDINWVKKTPNVFNKLPEMIDLCVIDGGEFSGYLEFMKLWKRSWIMVLDDISGFKHKKTREFILSNPDKFEVVNLNEKERNGFLICKNGLY